MGRKGGGRAGFFKAARKGPDSDEEEETAPAPAPTTKDTPKDAPKSDEPAAPKISAKAAMFLVDAGDGSDSDSADEEEERSAGGETRGQMTQRHKRETKALKEQIKRMGKKNKNETARLETEMKVRHDAELASLTFGGPVAAVSDDLEGVTLADAPAAKVKKPTKAQRRREEKATKDAEREARIAAEVAELGETERMAEEKALARLLAPQGFQVKDIPADGHCLYRSFEDQLSALPDGGAAALAAAGADGAELSYSTLRRVAAAHMRAHADAFRPFIDADETVPGGADGEETEEIDGFEAYCAALEGTAVWGGHVEIEALARALKTPVTVYTAGMPTLEVGEEYKEEGRAGVTLCYLRHAFGLGEHYNSVKPRQKKVTFEGDSDSDESSSEDEE
jgi:OTU domain-containing protein 6